MIVHLGAMGAVVRSTALLKAIRAKYPGAQITWVTDTPSDKLLHGHPQIDKVIRAEATELLAIQGRFFDVALIIDKSEKASGILAMTSAREVYGFTTDPRWGKIRPATPAAMELWQLGLDNELKFFVNQKTENHLVHEALELGPYQRDEYELHLDQTELHRVLDRTLAWRQNSSQPIIGLNTGCGPLMPAKKWTVEFQRQVVARLLEMGFENIVLLGGPEDVERNRQIAEGFAVLQSPCLDGIRDGAISVAACDLVLTGDSFAMHLAIAFRKFVIAWFGPSCAHEIDLYGRGVKLEAAVGCSPCWKRSCDKPVMCHDKVSLHDIEKAVLYGIDSWNHKLAPSRAFDTPGSP